MKLQRAAFFACITCITTASVCAFGANHFIETSDGQVALVETACRGSGQGATFNGRHKTSGTGIGCWFLDSGHLVTVRWSHVIGPTGKVFSIDQVSTYAAPSSLRSAPSMSEQVRPLVGAANQPDQRPAPRR
jgi:hypothetical protein